jgi:hypothetical protein
MSGLASTRTSQHPFFFFLWYLPIFWNENPLICFFLVVATGTSINLPFDQLLVLIKPPKVGSHYKEYGFNCKKNRMG